MGVNAQGVGKRGRGLPDLGKNLHGGGTGFPGGCVVDVDDNTANWWGRGGRIPPVGGPQAGGMATSER